MMVSTLIWWPNGKETSKVIDWNNRYAVRQFARLSTTALEMGAIVITKKTDNKEQGNEAQVG